MSIKGSKHRKSFIATIFCSRVMPVKNRSGPPSRGKETTAREGKGKEVLMCKSHLIFAVSSLGPSSATGEKPII